MVQTDRVGRFLALRWRRQEIEDEIKRLPAESPALARLQAKLAEVRAEEMLVLSQLSPQQRVQFGAAS